MTAEMSIVFACVVIALCLFVTEVVRVEITALGVAAFLMIAFRTDAASKTWPGPTT